SDLRGAEFRSIVILPTDQVARASAEMVVELISPLPWPISITDKLPHYVGPLDAVVVVGERSDADWASLALITAARRGATTALIRSEERRGGKECRWWRASWAGE